MLLRSGVGQKAQQYYMSYVNNANIKTVFSLAAEHTFVSINWVISSFHVKFVSMIRCIDT
jgi:hypothetical protein